MSPPKRLGSSCRWCVGSRGFCPPMCGCSTSAAPLRVSMPGSRRCAAITFIDCPPHHTGSSRSRRAMSPRGRDHWTSTKCLPRRGIWWDCTTSPRSAANAKAPPPSAICSGWTGRATATSSPRIVTADAFCWSMVRSLVGALLAVGEHRREPGWCATLLTSTRRSSDFAAAPSRGLTLVGVDYPPDDQLQARTKVTRDLRVID